MDDVKLKIKTQRYAKLLKALRPYSTAQDWDTLAKEWSPIGLWEDETCEEKCICGKEGLKECNEIQNKNTRQIVIVGSNCIDTLLGTETKSAFTNFRAIRKDLNKPLNRAAITYLSQLGALSKWENEFVTKYLSKYKVSDKIAEKRREINVKVLTYLDRRHKKV